MVDIKTIVRDAVVTAPPTMAITEIAAVLETENVGSVVITEDNRPVGIITDRDIEIDVVAAGWTQQKPPLAIS